MAAAANGGVATASSVFSSSYPASSVIDGDRIGAAFGSGGGWNDGTTTFPDWLQVNFAGPQIIGEIDVFNTQSSGQGTVNPTLTTTTTYGNTAFEVQYWNGSTWLDVPAGNVTGNNRVWRRFTFAPITTDRIRVLVNDAFDHLYSRLIELEALSLVYEQITGTATVNGQPTAGVALAASNGGTCTASDASGHYSCSVVQAWSGTVTPSLPGYVFVPASRSYASVQAAQSAQDYAGTLGTFTLSGSISANGAPLSGVTLSAGGGASCTTSDAAGAYSCTVTGGWSGTITPSPAGYSFTPASRSYASVVANQSAQNYAAAGVTIAGTVRLGGAPLAGAALSGGPGTACTASDASGQYLCTVPQGWSGTLMISASGYSFLPAVRAYVNAQANLAGEDFTAAVYAVSNTYYIEADYLNTPRVVANANGTAVWRWDQLEPFADSVPNSDPSGLGNFEFNLRFPGQLFDRESGLAQNVFRDYSPDLGRYSESDPIGIRGGTNTYSYAFRNPLRFVDPSGLLVTLQTRPITNAQGENMTFLSYLGGAHTWLELNPDHPEVVRCLLKPYGIDPPFPITLSAFPRDGMLTRFAGKPGQWEGPPTQSRPLTPPGGQGSSCDCGPVDPDSQFIVDLITRFNEYGDDLPYAANPMSWDTYNSNSFTNGLLGAAGYNGPLTPIAGDQNPVPASAFGRK